MKLIIFGATGSISRQVVNQALVKNHSVTAFARDITKVGIQHENLRTIQGDVMNPMSVESAIQGQEAVLVSIGVGRKGTVRSEGTRNIINAMKTVGVQRLICQSSLGVGDSRGNLNAFWKYIMFGLLRLPAYADHEHQENLVKQSDLQWTIVRPSASIDGEHTGQYRHGFASTDKTKNLSQ